MIEAILDLLYPNVCGFCNKISKNSLCKKCEIKFRQLTCTKRIVHKNKSYSEQFYLFQYNNEIREKIIQYKFQEKAYLYKTFAKMMINNEKICRFLKSYDIIIPVPIYKKRESERGYNQSELIAKELSSQIKTLKLESNILYKKTNNVPQNSLTKLQRIQNVKNIYGIKNIQKIHNKNIILFDDIYTTGNTVAECSKLLKQTEANKIGILTIAKD